MYNAAMEIISRDEAAAKGLKRYFTGESCRRGHTSERRVANFSCLECHRENQRALLQASEEYRARQKEASARWKATPNGKALTRQHNANRVKDPVKERERLRLLMRKKRATDRQYRIKASISRQINRHMKKGGRSTSSLLAERCGYTVAELLAHLEKQFTPGMGWHNYGKRGWHIDHIVPASSFDLTDEAEFKACWSLGNLRPLWAVDNAKKSAKHTHLV